MNNNFIAKFTRPAKLILIIFLFSNCLNAFGQLNPKTQTIINIPPTGLNLRFIWDGLIVNSKWEPNNAILIPIKIGNIPKTFYMQFDTGSPTTIFYRNKLQSLNAKFPGQINSEENQDLFNSSFKIGNTIIDVKQISMREHGNDAIDWDGNAKKEIIGTFGVDFFDQKIITIDYKHRRINISNSLAVKKELKLNFSTFTYVNKSLLFPALVGKRKTILFFDSGSSRYPLLTDKKTAEELAIDEAKVMQSNVQSFDKILLANSLATNETITIANRKLPIGYATYMEGVSSGQLAMMMKMGIGGMTGNKIFLRHKLIIDTKLKRFTILK